MSTMYVCKNCQEHYYPPKRKDGICKACNDAAAAKVNVSKEKHDAETEELKQLQASEMQALKHELEMFKQLHTAKTQALKHKQAAELEKLIAWHAQLLEDTKTITLQLRYQPPSTNDYLRYE